MPPGPLVTWRRLDGATGYVRIEAWVGAVGVEAALDDFRAAGTLVLALRDNPAGTSCSPVRCSGGSCGGRRLRGSIRFAAGLGGLSEPEPLTAEPAALRA